ncbi:MAG: tyrosine-type recombinase/integrase, partial [Candidatus Nanohalobium sp.]
IEESSRIQDYNKEVIKEFKRFLDAQDLSIDRISRYLYTWKRFTEHISWKIDEASKDNMIDLVADINKDRIRDRELSDHTKMEYKKALKKMYGDFLESKREDIDGESLTDFFSTTVPRKRTDPDRLPRPEHIKSMIKQADKIRDKAFMITLWSSGGRIGEVLGLQWKDVKFKDSLTSVKFRKTKTGGSRTVPLRAGVVYLQELQTSDEKSNDPDAYIFRSRYGDQMSYNAAYSIIDRCGNTCKDQNQSSRLEESQGNLHGSEWSQPGTAMRILWLGSRLPARSKVYPDGRERRRGCSPLHV